MLPWAGSSFIQAGLFLLPPYSSGWLYHIWGLEPQPSSSQQHDWWNLCPVPQAPRCCFSLFFFLSFLVLEHLWNWPIPWENIIHILTYCWGHFFPFLSCWGFCHFNLSLSGNSGPCSVGSVSKTELSPWVPFHLAANWHTSGKRWGKCGAYVLVLSFSPRFQPHKCCPQWLFFNMSGMFVLKLSCIQHM